jgi:hypothetical protein
MKSLKESMESKYDKEIELAKELTKQKEQETKQKEQETKQKEQETKQKEMEINLELKKLEFQLELRKLELQQERLVQPVIQQQVIVPEVHNIIKEFFDSHTVFSANNLDTIKMKELYDRYVVWIKVKYPTAGYPSNKAFTPKFKKLKIGIYKNSINNLSGTSGITNRKWR